MTAIEHEKELREVAQLAAKVAKLINQGGRHPDNFQREVSVEMPRRSPDAPLLGIEKQLVGVAAAIEAYLAERQR